MESQNTTMCHLLCRRLHMLAAEMLTLHILSALQTGVFIMFSHPHAPDAQVCWLAYGRCCVEV
jgi:hypothetical protein